MPSSGILRRVAFVRTDVSEERSASIIRLTRISELGRTLTTGVSVNSQCASVARYFLNLNPGQRRTLLQLKLLGILTIILFLT
jgi:hypothetical protein